MTIFQCKAERIKQYFKQFWAKADQSWSLYHVWSSDYPVGTNPKKEVTDSVWRCFNTFMRVCGQFIVTGMSKAVRLADFCSVISRVSLTHSLITFSYNIPLLRAVSGTGQRPCRPPRPVKGQCGMVCRRSCLFFLLKLFKVQKLPHK